MENKPADIILGEAGYHFDLSLLGLSKNNKTLSKIKGTQYADIRRLAMIRLYLCDSIDWGNYTKNDCSLKGSEIFVSLGQEEIEAITGLGIRQRDVLKIIDKAFRLYFADRGIQYSFEFDNAPAKKDYVGAISFLENIISKEKEYAEGGIRGYVNSQDVVYTMMCLVERFRFPDIIPNFEYFIKRFSDKDHMIKEESLECFYSYIISIIKEESRSPQMIGDIKEIVSANVRDVMVKE